MARPLRRSTSMSARPGRLRVGNAARVSDGRCVRRTRTTKSARECKKHRCRARLSADDDENTSGDQQKTRSGGTPAAQAVDTAGTAGRVHLPSRSEGSAACSAGSFELVRDGGRAVARASLASFSRRRRPREGMASVLAAAGEVARGTAGPPGPACEGTGAAGAATWARIAERYVSYCAGSTSRLKPSLEQKSHSSWFSSLREKRARDPG
jgi:hypothetical protein